MIPKLTPALAEDLRRRRHGKVGCSWYVDEMYLKVHGRWCYLYHAIDRSGALIVVMFSEHRDMAAARAFFRSAKATTGVTPDRVTTDRHDSYPRAIRTELGKEVRHRTRRYLNNRLEQDHRGIKGRYWSQCAASSARDRPPGSAGPTTKSATFFASAPATINTFPPIAADSCSSVAQRSCSAFWKPPDETLPRVQKRRLRLLARALTEPATQAVQEAAAGRRASGSRTSWRAAMLQSEGSCTASGTGSTRD